MGDLLGTALYYLRFPFPKHPPPSRLETYAASDPSDGSGFTKKLRPHVDGCGPCSSQVAEFRMRMLAPPENEDGAGACEGAFLEERFDSDCHARIAPNDRRPVQDSLAFDDPAVRVGIGVSGSWRVQQAFAAKESSYPSKVFSYLSSLTLRIGRKTGDLIGMIFSN